MKYLEKKIEEAIEPINNKIHLLELEVENLRLKEQHFKERVLSVVENKCFVQYVERVSDYEKGKKLKTAIDTLENIKKELEDE